MSGANHRRILDLPANVMRQELNGTLRTLRTVRTVRTLLAERGFELRERFLDAVEKRRFEVDARTEIA